MVVSRPTIKDMLPGLGAAAVVALALIGWVLFSVVYLRPSAPPANACPDFGESFKLDATREGDIIHGTVELGQGLKLFVRVSLDDAGQPVVRYLDVLAR